MFSEQSMELEIRCSKWGHWYSKKDAKDFAALHVLLIIGTIHYQFIKIKSIVLWCKGKSEFKYNY